MPESRIADELGYRVLETGFGERILAHAIVERFGREADGTLEC
jgi:hypothetical protein